MCIYIYADLKHALIIPNQGNKRYIRQCITIKNIEACVADVLCKRLTQYDDFGSADFGDAQGRIECIASYHHVLFHALGHGGGDIGDAGLSAVGVLLSPLCRLWGQHTVKPSKWLHFYEGHSKEHF